MYYTSKREDPNMMKMKDSMFKMFWKNQSPNEMNAEEISRAVELIVWFFDSARSDAWP